MNKIALYINAVHMNGRSKCRQLLVRKCGLAHPRYRHLVATIAAVGMHVTGMHSRFKSDCIYQIG